MLSNPSKSSSTKANPRQLKVQPILKVLLHHWVDRSCSPNLFWHRAAENNRLPFPLIILRRWKKRKKLSIHCLMSRPSNISKIILTTMSFKKCRHSTMKFIIVDKTVSPKRRVMLSRWSSKRLNNFNLEEPVDTKRIAFQSWSQVRGKSKDLSKWTSSTTDMMTIRVIIKLCYSITSAIDLKCRNS